MALARKEGRHEEEVLRVRKDGSTFWADEYTTPLCDDDGKLRGYAKIIRDITERRQAQDALAEQNRLLDLAHVLIRNPHDRIVTWNTGLEALYGYSKEDAVGRVSHDLLKTVFPESREAVTEALSKTGHWNGELVHMAKDGHKVVVASHQVTHRDEQGNVLAIIETNNDVTDLKQAEQEREITVEIPAAGKREHGKSRNDPDRSHVLSGTIRM